MAWQISMGRTLVTIRRRIAGRVAGWLLFLALPALVHPAPAAPGPEAGNVLAVVWDGMRADALGQARTPFLDLLRACGASTVAARVVGPSLTLPSHACLLSGVGPERHGVDWNSHRDPRRMTATNVMRSATEAKLSTGFVVGKRKLLALLQRGDATYPSHPGYTARRVAEKASRVIRKFGPRVMFLQFPDPDEAGHRFDWMSPEYLAAVEACDLALGEVLRALVETGSLARTVVIVTADHGGHGRSHGTRRGEDCIVPFVIAGRGVRKDGATIAGRVRTVDVAATMLHAVGLPVPAGWDGRPVLEAFAPAVQARRLAVAPYGL